MCFFACLTAGAVYMMNKSASAWLKNIASEITVQVEPIGTPEQQQGRLRDVIAFLGSQPEIVDASLIPVETSRALLEPWLGDATGLDALPIPRLIAIRVDRSQTAGLQAHPR